jgi:uncharacterized protein YcaQ
MAKPTHVYPLTVIRTLALHAQGLAAKPGTEPKPTADSIHDLIEQIGCVQIDTLQMVQRSQYLALWSRLGTYDPADFDHLIYANKNGDGINTRRLFEYWLHAACVIPLSLYRYRLPVMRWFEQGNSHWFQQWLSQPGNAELIQAVLERVRNEGAMRAADFEHDGSPRGSWWDWKPAKNALEQLYNEGRLMIADRVNFQRVYDVRERVLPAWVDTREPTRQEMLRHLLEHSVRALGVCLPVQAADYFYLKRTEAKPMVQDLITSGVIVEVRGELADGKSHTLIVHRDHLPALEQAADGALKAERTTFLSPFDSLLWARERDMQLFGFDQRLEAYTPAPKRRWGYFCLPVLHHERLVGRFDPKLERRSGTLRLKALYLEPGIAPDDELVASVAGTLRDFMAFHKATELVVERSEPAGFGKKLLATASQF